jgi:hypothetical protein
MRDELPRRVSIHHDSKATLAVSVCTQLISSSPHAPAPLRVSKAAAQAVSRVFPVIAPRHVRRLARWASAVDPSVDARVGPHHGFDPPASIQLCYYSIGTEFNVGCMGVIIDCAKGEDVGRDVYGYGLYRSGLHPVLTACPHATYAIYAARCRRRWGD